MDKSIKINLAGTLFQIDEEAYRMLRDYLQAINEKLKNVQGGIETIDDIESRIAEIFNSQRGTAGIITKDNVEAVIGIIGKPGDFETGEPAVESSTGYSRKRRLYRNPGDSIIAGVCGGIGAYMNIDPVWIRLIFILFTFSFGVGLFIYLALWIALPSAFTDYQKRELYGDNFSMRSAERQGQAAGASGDTTGNAGGPNKDNNLGNALNEIFRAIGKILFVIARIFLIAIGVTFVIAGFALLVTFIMTFFLRFPWFISDQSISSGFFYLPDMLDFLMSPALTPWVIILFSLVVILPLLALIYWGIKMIFWFRVRDWIVSLAALLIWVISISALALIMFSQGISFAEKASRVDQTIIETKHDTLWIITDRKISSLSIDQEITLPDDEYSLFINKKDNELYGKPELAIRHTPVQPAKISVERYSHGKTRREAVEKAESFRYNFRLSGDTILLDQFYMIPSEYKWSGSVLEIEILIPDGTIVWIDRDCELLFDNYQGNEINSWMLGDKFWKWTEDGPMRAEGIGSK